MREREREGKKDDNEFHEEAYHADTNKYTLNDEQIMRSHELCVPGEYTVNMSVLDKNNRIQNSENYEIDLKLSVIKLQSTYRSTQTCKCLTRNGSGKIRFIHMHGDIGTMPIRP